MNEKNMERMIQAVEPIVKLGYCIENSLTASMGDTVPFQTLEKVFVKLDGLNEEVTASVNSFLHNVDVDYKSEFDYITYLRQSDITPFFYFYYNRVVQVLKEQLQATLSEHKSSDIQQQILCCFKDVCELYNQEFDPAKSNEPFENKQYKFQNGITNEIKAAIQSSVSNIPDQNLKTLFNALDRSENEISVISDLCNDSDGWYEVYCLWDRSEELLEEHLQEVLSYHDYMKIRNNVLDILQNKCDELDLMNKFEYYGEILRRKSLKRVQWEQNFIETNYKKSDWREIDSKLNGEI